MTQEGVGQMVSVARLMWLSSRPHDGGSPRTLVRLVLRGLIADQRLGGLTVEA
jgi:hypothetical protein